jgi:hypothetical protein
VRQRRRAGLLLVGLLLVLAVTGLAASALADDPSFVPDEPTAPPIELLEGGDLRSEGEGPGLVGNPLLILVAVVALGAATVGTTVLLVRLTQRD